MSEQPEGRESAPIETSISVWYDTIEQTPYRIEVNLFVHRDFHPRAMQEMTIEMEEGGEAHRVHISVMNRPQSGGQMSEELGQFCAAYALWYLFRRGNENTPAT